MPRRTASCLWRSMRAARWRELIDACGVARSPTRRLANRAETLNRSRDNAIGWRADCHRLLDEKLFDRPVMKDLPASPPRDAATPAGLDEFRMTSLREIAGALLALADRKVPLALTVGTEEGSYTTILWSVDVQHDSLGFWADVSDHRLQPLLEHRQATAVGHLDNVKLQFEARDLVLVRGDPVSVLRCPMPREIYRFQRRDAFRVRPLREDQPTARFIHSDLAEVALQLRIIDVSIGGCALHIPDDLPIPQAGALLRQVELDLDVDTNFEIDLRVVNVCPLGANSVGMRLGCAFVDAGGDVIRALQRFIDDAQKRRASAG